MQRIFFFDLETSGFRGIYKYSNYHKIVQFAVLEDATNRLFNRYVNTDGYTILEKSTKIHNITNDQVEKADKFPIVWSEFIRFYALKSYETVIFVAHNCFGFDRLVLLKEMFFYNIPQKKNWFFADSLVYFKYLADKRLRDEIETTIDGFSKYNLNSLYAFFNKGLSITNQHSADADVIALKDICKKTNIDFFNDLPLMSFDTNDSRWSFPAIRCNSSLIELKGIGTARLKKIQNHLGDVSNVNDFLLKTVGEIPNKKNGEDEILIAKMKQIELFFREKIELHDDTYLVEILSHMSCRNPLQLLQTGFPFATEFSGRFDFDQKTKETLEFRSIHQLINRARYDNDLKRFLQQAKYRKAFQYYNFILS